MSDHWVLWKSIGSQSQYGAPVYQYLRGLFILDALESYWLPQIRPDNRQMSLVVLIGVVSILWLCFEESVAPHIAWHETTTLISTFGLPPDAHHFSWTGPVCGRGEIGEGAHQPGWSIAWWLHSYTRGCCHYHGPPYKEPADTRGLCGHQCVVSPQVTSVGSKVWAEWIKSFEVDGELQYVDIIVKRLLIEEGLKRIQKEGN